MENKLHFKSKAEYVYYDILLEKEKIGYYDLPIKNHDYLYRLDRFEQKHIVVVGIGGSSLGAKAAHAFLRYRYEGHKQLHFIEGNDPLSLKQHIKEIDINNALFVIISKSGTTIETMSNFKYLLKFKALNPYDYIFVTDRDSKLALLGRSHDIEVFSIPYHVGGRFSVLSAAGLVPLYLMGYDIRRMLLGANEVRESFFKEKQIKDAILEKASFYANNASRYPINILFSYGEQFTCFNQWYMQLWAESLGKKQCTSMKGVGLTPIGLIGSHDQHSFLQLITEGPSDKTVTFLKVKEYNDTTIVPEHSLEYLGKTDFVNGIEFSKLINLQADAVVDSIRSTIPVDEVEIERVDEYSIGELFYYYQLLTSVTGRVLDVNTYDQPGVEASKQALRNKLL